MDTPEQAASELMNRLVSGIKDKTIKMAEDQLRKVIPAQETPSEAILGFVASAVASGAQRLEVRVETNDLVLSHDGKMLHPTEVASLRHGSGATSELGAALRLQLATSEGKVDLRFISPLGMHKAGFRGQAEPALSDADLGDLRLAKFTTQITLLGTGNHRRVNQALGNELPEVSLIRRRCFMAPLDLQISGRPLMRFTHLPPSLVTGVNFHKDPKDALSSLPSSPNHGVSVDLAGLAPKLHAITAGVCGIAKSPADAGWFRLRHGVARPLPELAWPARTWGFINVSSHGHCEQLGREIGLLSAMMIRELFTAFTADGSQHGVDDDTLVFLEQQRQTLLDLGFEPIELDRTFLSLRQSCLPSSDPRVLSSRLELAASLETQGETSEAHRQYAEVLPIWESEALNHFDKYRFEEGAALWQRALLLHDKLGTPPSEIASKHLKLAEIGKEQRLGFAEQSYRKALAIYRSLAQPEPAHELTTLLGLAEVLKTHRVFTESLRYAEDAQRAQLELSGGRETKELIPILKLQAEIHDLLGDYVRSTDFEQKALMLRFGR